MDMLCLSTVRLESNVLNDTHKSVKASTRHLVPKRLGDFAATPRMLLIILLSLVVGAISSLIAFALLRLIGLITNVLFYQRLDVALVSPGLVHNSAWLIISVPVIGGLVVGLIARYGSEMIRGHGIPEALDVILRGGSKIPPRVAIYKPIASAITIGTGGPFGAEGPIIMSGGAFGSVLAQFLKLSADERKTLLVAGAAAGMAATFNAPLASILLAAELLLFELKPRSLIPVAAAVLVATICRHPLLGYGAIFPVVDPHLSPSVPIYLLCAVAGLTGAILAWGATVLVYLSEDTFAKLPIHWMWWPAIGGLIIGIGGLFEPRALGVGYDVIRDLLQGHATLSLIVGILIVKTVIWSLSLGSGTSGGVLAPVFMIGASLGALEAYVLPHVAPGFWPLISLAAVVGGVMRSPLTGVIFALELTHEWSAMVALTISSFVAYAASVLMLKRSVLTEKVVRKGLHLTREYSVDPLEVLFVRDVMERDIISFLTGASLKEAAASFLDRRREIRDIQHRQRIYPVVDSDQLLIGIVTRRDMFAAALAPEENEDKTVNDLMLKEPAVAHEDMTLREVSYLLADHHVSRLPVVQHGGPARLIGLITVMNVLKGRLVDLQEERDTERVLYPRQMLRSLSFGRIRSRMRRKPADSGRG